MIKSRAGELDSLYLFVTIDRKDASWTWNR